MSKMKVIGAAGAVAAMLMLQGCVAMVPLAIAGAGTGALDVSTFHGCIGITMANMLPWTQKYDCQARPVSVAKADQATEK